MDACLLVTPQHAADYFRDPLGRGGRLVLQPGEHLPHLRHRHRRRFSPPAAAAPVPGTTAPAATASCGGASPPTTAPRTAPAPPPPCPRPAAPPPGAAARAPGPAPPASPAA